MWLISRFLRIFFYLLYHPFAWAYDFVAWAVSLGHWDDWVKSVIPFIEGPRTLELGHGPGHLQRILRDRNLLSFGLDESYQMGNLAKKHLARNGYAQINLVRGNGLQLPFGSKTFDSIVATFPTEYIYEKGTLLEIRRTLKNGSRLIVLPVAWITGTDLLNQFAAWLFRITGQAPSDLSAETIAHLVKPFQDAGLHVESKTVAIRSSKVLILIARK